MSKLKQLLKEAKKADEKVKIYQLAVNYLGEINDGIDSTAATEPGVSMLSRDTLMDVIEELKDRQEDILDSAEKLVDEPKKPRKVPRKKPPKKSAE